MDLVIFLVLLVSTESLAYRGNCGSDDYYQDRHHGIRRYYQRTDLSPDEFYPHQDPSEDADDLINQGPDEFDDTPFIILPKRSRWNRIKYSKLISRHQPKNIQNLGYRAISKHSDTDEYNSPDLGTSNDVKELIPRKKSYGSSIYRQTNANIQERTHQDGINSGIIISRVKNSRSARSKHRSLGADSDLDEDIAEVDHFNTHPTIIISTRSDTDIDTDDEDGNTNINTNANINSGAGGSTILLSTRRNALNSEAEYGEVSDIVPNDNELNPTSSGNPKIIISTRRKQTEGNENQNINVNSNVNAENSGGSPSVVIGARSSMLNSERQLHDFRRDAGGLKKNAAANTNKNVNVNSNVNSEGESNPAVPTAARRNSLKTEANYGSRSNILDNQFTGVRRNNNNNNNNINVNANVNSEDAESSPEIIVAGRRKTLKGDANYGSRRNIADNESAGARQNDNKNVNVNTNVNADGERNAEILIAARRHALKAEASYGARSNGRNSEADDAGIFLQGRGEVDPTDILGRRNTNENSNVNINVNAEDAGGSPSILTVARRRLSAFNDNDRNFLPLPRQNIVRRSQAPKNENRNVNINVNRLESDEV